jgi:hypothetical protein
MADTYTNIADAIGRYFTVAEGNQATYTTLPSQRRNYYGDQFYYYGGTVLGGAIAGQIIYPYQNYINEIGQYWDAAGGLEFSGGNTDTDYLNLNKNNPWFGATLNGKTVYYPFTENYYILPDGSYLSYNRATTPKSASGAGGSDTGGSGVPSSGGGAGSGTNGSGSGSGSGSGMGPNSPVEFNPLGLPIGLGGYIYNFIKQIVEGLVKNPLTWVIVLLLLSNMNKNEKNDK